MKAKFKLIFDQYRYALNIVWKSSRGYTISRLVAIFFKAVLPVAQLLFMKLVIDELTAKGGFDESRKDELVLYLVYLGVVLLLNGIVQNISQYIEGLQQQSVADYIAGLLQKKSIAMDLELYDDPAYHDSYFLAHRHGLSRPIQLVADLMAFVENLIAILFVGGLIFFIHPLVPLLLFISVLPSALIKYIFSDKLFKWEKKRALMERKGFYLNRIITEAEYAKEVRVFDAGLSLSERFQALRKVLFVEKKSLFGLRARMGIGGKTIEICAEIFSYAFLTYRAVNGMISIGELAMVFPAFQRGKTNLSGVLQSMVKLLEHRLFLSHLIGFMKLEPKIGNDENALPLSERITSGIELREVSFQYPKTGVDAVSGVSLNLKRGEITALVGENGSGKTTLVKLICRLYDPSSGELHLDGKNYKAIRLSDLRSKMSITFQDFAKYFLTVGENISFSNLSGDEDTASLEAYARLTGANTFIDRLPDRYDQQLGRMFEASAELSIGQWQKVALARMFFKEAEVLIVDEPTSAIDPLSEHNIFENLRELARDKIVILVTHRLYNLKIANQVVVMSGGKIVERGSHDELVALDGQYAQMLNKQL
ncbi:MAG: ABC transporter ATP-binding protein [Roseivirga sp.]|nr:ABC transporter ATP-binding protein [Roseivirga sp.]